MDNMTRAYATAIGNLLAKEYPAVAAPGANHKGFIPADGVVHVADEITLVIAEIIQSWLDAGSERDVTMEELGQSIEDHVAGWSERCWLPGYDDQGIKEGT